MQLLTLLGINPVFAFWGMIGLVLHFLKTWRAATSRNEAFFKRETYLFYTINLVSTLAIIGIGAELPPELYVSSKVSSLMVGLSASSMLSGFMKTKVPFDMVPEDKAILKITKDSNQKDITP